MDNADNNNNNNNNNNKDNDDNNLMVIDEGQDHDEGQDQEQSLLIKKRKVNNDEAFKAKTETTLRLIGSQIPGHKQVPLTRFKICKSATIWNLNGTSFSKYAKGHMPQIVICELCVKDAKYDIAEINYGKAKSTSNVSQHLRSHHYKVFEEYVGNIANTEKNSIVNNYQALSKNDIRNHVKPTASTWMIPLCKLIVNNYQPLCYVENVDFRNFCSGIESKSQHAMRSNSLY